MQDRCDIQAGKKVIPGALVNIDYWQEYDVEEVMLSGYPVITTMPSDITTLCFRCGSAGKEQVKPFTYVLRKLIYKSKWLDSL